jgi:L-ascorbate 6-phosphate lactonase
MKLAARIGRVKVRSGTIACAWLGQAGYLLKTRGGLTVMIDPYLSDEGAFSSHPSPRPSSSLM